MRKKRHKSTGKITKGTSTSLLLSIGIHAVLFFLAGMLVIFTVVKKEEQVFEPPKAVERPKMKLKKPKVKVKKASKPRPSRIVSKTTRNVMPQIDLPSLGDMGSGGDEMIVGLDLMEGMTETTIFGSGQTIGTDFVGTFYDLKRDAYGNGRHRTRVEAKDIISKFVRSGFNPATLTNVFRSPNKLYATCFMVPTVRSADAPKAFGEDTGGWTWMVHYKGSLVHKDGITFRFRGHGDDVLIVRVDGEIVLNASWPGNEPIYTPHWQSVSSQTRTFQLGNNRAAVGDWITLEPGVPMEMEVVGGEIPGGHFCMMLVVEEKDVEYPLNSQQGPILPMFKTAEPNHDLRDIIYKNLVPGEASVTNGPVFSDLAQERVAKVPSEGGMVEEEPPADADAEPLRNWSLASGKSIEGEMVSFVAGQVVLEVPGGRQVKVPLKELTAELQEYVELMNPPVFNIEFSKKSEQVLVETTTLTTEDPARQFDFSFGVTVDQRTTREYRHELSAEYFAIGQQLRDSNKFILLDRDEGTFTLLKENQRSYEFKGERTVEMISYDLTTQVGGSRYGQIFGEKYKGYLVLLRDKRGEIIQYAASNDWLYENREDLMKLPIGSYFDKSCKRVHPTSPDRLY